ncbi:MAG TPA: NADH-quinone oxidoreductase subunit C [Acidimicrobiia bacterium]
MTASPSEAPTLEEYGASVAAVAGGEATVQFGTVKVKVRRDQWKDSLEKARDKSGLLFFSWLSAIDWSNQVEVGDPLTDEIEERIELMAAVGDLDEGRLVIFATDLAKESLTIDSLTTVYAGADWHEREAHEMFGIEFVGHPGLEPLYLPDGFEGHPLRKSFPLLSREVKPWPGKVDVEGMPGTGDSAPDEPSTENPEA